MITPLFTHFFVFYSNVYGSPYSSCDVDFMDGAVSICSFPGQSAFDESTNERIARLLESMSLYAQMMQELKGKQGYYKAYYSWAYRQYYSLASRLLEITGLYSYRAILETCNLPDVINS